MANKQKQIYYIDAARDWLDFKCLYGITQQQLDTAFDGDQRKWKQHIKSNPADYLIRTYETQ